MKFKFYVMICILGIVSLFSFCVQEEMVSVKPQVAQQILNFKTPTNKCCKCLCAWYIPRTLTNPPFVYTRILALYFSKDQPMYQRLFFLTIKKLIYLIVGLSMKIILRYLFLVLYMLNIFLILAIYLTLLVWLNNLFSSYWIICILFVIAFYVIYLTKQYFFEKKIMI